METNNTHPLETLTGYKFAHAASALLRLHGPWAEWADDAPALIEDHVYDAVILPDDGEDGAENEGHLLDYSAALLTYMQEMHPPANPSLPVLEVAASDDTCKAIDPAPWKAAEQLEPHGLDLFQVKYLYTLTDAEGRHWHAYKNAHTRRVILATDALDTGLYRQGCIHRLPISNAVEYWQS